MPSNNSLLLRLTRYSHYEEQFTRAKNLVEDILAHQAPEGLQVLSTDESYYTDHGVGHIQRVISKLEALDALLRIPVNEKEAFILLVAAYFHDIGMFLGRREGEDAETARREHHRRGADIIQKLNDEHYLDIDSPELSIIKKVIEAHRVIDLKELPESQMIEGIKIRTRLLGALLRIADSCDCDRSRAPKAIFDLFYESIPENSKEYWRIHFPITDVTFEDRRASIAISINFAGEPNEKIEKYRIANLLKKSLRKSCEALKQYSGIILFH